ncbi:Pre-rRNA-processing protein esf1 [Euphorbia peplus]|nr:Pre-rRNA-processing protein esf1 [Euphorbia peplus]
MGSNKKANNKPTKDSVAGAGAGDNNHREADRKIIADPRFASVHYDPRFQNVPKRKTKVPIDSRFSSMFTDKKFASGTAPSDKRGKPQKQKPETSLRHFYSIEEEEEEGAIKEALKEKKVVSDEEESESEEEEELGISDSEPRGSKSSSELEADETESTTDEDEDEEGVIYADDLHEVQVENVATVEDGTRRLAAVKMDWRHVRAVDLYVVLSSFLPKGGEISSVAVYPSDFGLQRMKEEELHGPVGLFDSENKGSDSDQSDSDDEIDEAKLQAYEISRMDYYYAVVECNSVATAEHLYKACDGVEFERSSNVLDLRFIPDSMEFKHPPRDVATEAPGSYDALDFHTKALQHSNINITWDEDEPQRAKTLQRKFNADQLADLELKEFLASDESESDEDENDDDAAGDESDKKLKKRDKYLALIGPGDGSDGEDDEETQDMEITFNTGLEGLSKRILEKRDKKAETVWEEHLRKQREKKKARKSKSKNSSEDESSDDDDEPIEEAGDFFVEEPSAKKAKKAKHDTLGKNDEEAEAASKAELELLLADDDGVGNGLKGYNLKHKNSKGKKGKEVPDENKIPAIDYEDPRFSALFNSSLFSLDPTNPQFKRSATYARQLAHRQQTGNLEAVEGEHKKHPTESQLSANEADVGKNKHIDSDTLASRREKHEISSLVKSIKMKSSQVKFRSNTKSSTKKTDKKLQVMEKPEVPSFSKSVKKKGKVMKK